MEKDNVFNFLLLSVYFMKNNISVRRKIVFTFYLYILIFFSTDFSFLIVNEGHGKIVIQ